MSNDENEINYFGSFVTTQEKDNDKAYNNTLTKLESSTEIKTNKESEIVDDYSAYQSFEEQKKYDLKTQTNNFLSQEKETEEFKPINMPLVEKKQVETPILDGHINLSARMKLLLASFIVIVASLVFATVWNFVAINKYSSSMAVKSETISELKVSINNLTDEYNKLGDIENLKKLIEEAGFIESNDSNTITISLDDMYKEHKIEEVPSNWFNDVCDFISSIFK